MLGGNTAFTVQQDNDELKGYVLNRNSRAVQAEEFVTPSPSPTPDADSDSHADANPDSHADAHTYANARADANAVAV